MKPNFLFTCVFLSIILVDNAYSQLKIGSSPQTVDPSAILHVESSNKGVLLPKVSLSSATDQTTISAPATGLLVYNTGTGGLTPAGYYFWDGSRWSNFRLSGPSGAGQGSPEYINYRIITGTYTPTNPAVVSPNDHLILLRYSNTSTGSLLNISSDAPFLNPNATLILPDPTSCPGRVLRIVNDSHRIFLGGKDVYTNYPMWTYDVAISYNTKPGALSYSVLASLNASQWVIFSDGQRWISINVVIV